MQRFGLQVRTMLSAPTEFAPFVISSVCAKARKASLLRCHSEKLYGNIGAVLNVTVADKVSSGKAQSYRILRVMSS